MSFFSYFRTAFLFPWPLENQNPSFKSWVFDSSHNCKNGHILPTGQWYAPSAVYSVILCYILLYSALLCFTLLYSAPLCSTLLYSALLCFTLLYSALHCFTLLYSALLCFTLLYMLYSA